MDTPGKSVPDPTSKLLSTLSPQVKYLKFWLPPAFLLMLLAWGLINILQSILTEIGDDEAYYWMYSKHLDWGYFDHPPMIALFIKAGTLWFDKELGVRCITVMAQLLTLIIMWFLTRDKFPSTKKILLFFGIAASVVMFHVYGFMSTPDAPLLLFTACFLLSYRKFLEKDNLLNMFFLAFSMAGLLYSKYHGLLVIFFGILSNPRLLLNKNLWMAGIATSILCIPHMVWQFQHDFVSFQFHLVSRSRAFDIKNVINYWPNQLVSFNPFFLGLIIFLMFRFKPRDVFERALYFLSGGFLITFFISSFRGHVEPHWTISACIGMIIIVYNRCLDHIPTRKFVYWFLVPSIVLLIILRIGLIIDFLPFNAKIHGRKENNAYLSSLAGHAPVVFYNSYQKPSVYTFYTGKPATTLNGFHNRKSQYDLWQFEQSFFGEEAVFITDGWDVVGTPFKLPDGKTNYLYQTKNFFTTQRLEVNFNSTLPDVMYVGDTIRMEIELYNPYPFPLILNHPEYPVLFRPIFFISKKVKTFITANIQPPLSELAAHERKKLNIDFIVPEMLSAGYHFGIALKAGSFQESRNSDLIPIEVRSHPPE